MKRLLAVMVVLMLAVPAFGQFTEEVPKKKPVSIAFPGNGLDSSIYIEDKIIRIVNPKLREPYNEIIMLNTPENFAQVLELNDAIKQFSIMVRAVIIKVNQEKAELEREAIKQHFHDPIWPDGPLPTQAVPFKP